jgi:hypothetical protein
MLRSAKVGSAGFCGPSSNVGSQCYLRHYSPVLLRSEAHLRVAGRQDLKVIEEQFELGDAMDISEIEWSYHSVHRCHL